MNLIMSLFSLSLGAPRMRWDGNQNSAAGPDGSLTHSSLCFSPPELLESPRSYSGVSDICAFAHAVSPAGEAPPSFVYLVHFAIVNTLLKRPFWDPKWSVIAFCLRLSRFELTYQAYLRLFKLNICMFVLFLIQWDIRVKNLFLFLSVSLAWRLEEVSTIHVPWMEAWTLGSNRGLPRSNVLLATGVRGHGAPESVTP